MEKEHISNLSNKKIQSLKIDPSFEEGIFGYFKIEQVKVILSWKSL